MEKWSARNYSRAIVIPVYVTLAREDNQPRSCGYGKDATNLAKFWYANVYDGNSYMID